jgi:hypothetical protein
VLALLAVSCASAPPESRVLREHTDLKMTTSQLRLQVRSLAKPFSGIIEGAADQILQHATTPEERIAALRFKINGVPAFQGALFEPDPVAAAFETAALIAQTQAFLEEGPAAIAPPLVKENILQSLEEMRNRVRSLGDQIGSTPESQERFWTTAEEWAREHPITGSFPGRETTQALFAEYMAAEPSGIFATARRMEETIADLAWRFDVYGEYIAKQVRWQGELMLEESLARDLPRRALRSVEPVQVGVSDLPVDIDVQRDLILAAVRAERALVLDWVRNERLETLDFVRMERQVVAGLVGTERQLVLEALRVERKAILAQVAEERAAAMQDLSGIVTKALEASQRQVIDHLVWRIVQVLAVALPLCFFGAWFLIWYAKRR